MVTVRTYLDSRIRRSDYRGIHLAQHNRLPEEKLVSLLSAIHSVVGQSFFFVPPGDDPNPSRIHRPSAPRSMPEFRDYFSILDAISRHSRGEASATFNSLKKNHFPNFESMGLLERRRTNGAGRRVLEARLTDAAVAIIAAGASRQRAVLIGEAMERIIGEPFIEQLHTLLSRLDMLNVYEIMLIVSDESLDVSTKEDLVRQYRRLKAIGRLQLHADIEEKCAPTMRLSKPERRDWHNWWNEARQIVTMLSFVSGFNVYKEELVMLAGASGMALFLPVRSESVKRDALEWHQRPRIEGWDLHHIYPVEYATCESDMRLIDAKENLLYIPAMRHHEIPRTRNLSVKLTYDSTHVVLVNPVSGNGEPKFEFLIPQDVGIETSKLPQMVAYNTMLLNTVA